jgi:hypothetical protein
MGSEKQLEQRLIEVNAKGRHPASSEETADRRQSHALISYPIRLFPTAGMVAHLRAAARVLTVARKSVRRV